ncbi:hypothetical protein V6N12_046358 [Hibiscus sabdariffa]|uniref:Uncharacterized protein n=1 Tax=Hibiscus sabdariffa TaxID=183260 RepID=A0ABR2DJK6_9ROSI
MSRTDDIMDSGQGGRPSEATLNAGNVLVLDVSDPMSSSGLMQDKKENPVVDASMTDMGPELEGADARSNDIGIGLGGVVNRRRRNGTIQNNSRVKGGLSKTKDAMGSRYLVLVEEKDLDEVTIVPESHGVATERSRGVPGNKEGLGSGSKKKGVGSSSTILNSSTQQNQIGELTDVASTGC